MNSFFKFRQNCLCWSPLSTSLQDRYAPAPPPKNPGSTPALLALFTTTLWRGAILAISDVAKIGKFNTNFCIQFRIALKSMRNQCQGQRKSLTVQLNSRKVRIEEFYIKVCIDLFKNCQFRTHLITVKVKQAKSVIFQIRSSRIQLYSIGVC